MRWQLCATTKVRDGLSALPRRTFKVTLAPQWLTPCLTVASFFGPLLHHAVMKLLTCLLALALSSLSFQAGAQAKEKSAWTDGFDLSLRDGDHLSIMYSPYTNHFTRSDEHKYVWLIGVERERADGALSGISYFSNSFGQPSAYIFPWGQTYRDIGNVSGLYAKWTAGLIYGYKDPYENKVPLNSNGYSPGLIPALGYEVDGWQAQVNLLGTAGIMFQVNKRIK